MRRGRTGEGGVGSHLGEVRVPRCSQLEKALGPFFSFVAASLMSSTSDSDSDSKPEAKNSSTVNSASRLQVISGQDLCQPASHT